MSTGKDSVRLLAVAMPKAVLEEYESVVLAAGYLPGAVLPSTLAALAGLDEAEAPVLVVNAGLGTVTTAIVQAGTLLLHHSVDMSVGGNAALAVSVAAAYFEDSLQRPPDQLLVAGTLGAESLAAMMEESGLEGLRVREMVEPGMIEPGAVTANVPRGWLAGVRGAL